MNDKELDRKLAEQEKAGADSYRYIMKALETEPSFDSSRTLADGVIHKLGKKRSHSRNNYWLSMLLITAAFVIIGFGSLMIFMGWEGFSEIKDLSIYGIMLGLMVVVIQYLDDKLFRRDLRFS